MVASIPKTAGANTAGNPNARWQEYFDEYCLNELGGRNPEGREFDEASAYADERLEEEEDE